MVYLVFKTDGGSTHAFSQTIKDFELVNLLNSGSVIGTARVKSIQVVNNETRIYLMDIQMKGTVDSSVQITNVESIERHGDFDTPPHTFLVKTAVVVL